MQNLISNNVSELSNQIALLIDEVRRLNKDVGEVKTDVGEVKTELKDLKSRKAASSIDTYDEVKFHDYLYGPPNSTATSEQGLNRSLSSWIYQMEGEVTSQTVADIIYVRYVFFIK